ncbi:MAG: 4Fe-4S binding protein [Firmicutes bacterium]|nr:4Fe-4S binding protein [Bacillota bacterium]
MLGLKTFGFKILPEVFRNIIKPPATIKYPAEKTETPAGFRGRIIFEADKCIGCKMCLRDCPAGAIHIEPTGVAKQFKCVFLLDRCLFCAQCVDSCPRKALTGTPQYELACFERDQFEDVQE